MKEIDICIPAYNEEEIIAATLRAILVEADRHPEIICRLIVANNASTDNTGSAAESIGDSRISVIKILQKGKGIAIRTVALASDAEYFAYIDADLSVGPDELFRLFTQLIEWNTDIVIGSRLLDTTKITRVWWRTLLSKIFNVFGHILVPVGVKDTQCGLKIMNTKGRKVLGECRESAWFLDIEFLARARRAGLSVKEVPVVWNEYHYPNRATKLKVWREGILAIIAMVRIRAHIEQRGIGTKLSRHWKAFAIALCAGIFCIAPALYFAQVTPGYRGITMMGSDAEEQYTARIEEVYDGHSGLGNVFLSQKNQPYFAPNLGERIVAGIGMLSGLSAASIVVFSKFLFPFLIALLVYALAYILSASPLGATLAAAFVIFGDAVLGGPSVLWGVISGHTPITSFLLYARPINPEISALFLFSALLILFHSFFKKRMPTRSASIVLGLLAGGALYVSSYVSSFLFTVLAISALWFLFRKEKKSAAMLLMSIGTGFLIIVPFLLNFIRLHQNALFAASSIRQGLIHTHTPIIGLWLTVLIIALFIWPRRLATARPFFAISIVALFILLNQQMVTGFALQPAHYHWYLTKPLAGMVLSLFVVFFIERLFQSKIVHGVLYSAGFGLLLGSALLVQKTSYQAQYATTLSAQAYAPVLSFLQTLPAGQSVWADRGLSLYIPIYTKQDAPDNDAAEYYLVPQTFLENRLSLEYALRKIPSADAFSAMQNEREDIANRLFGVYWRDQHGSYSAIPDSVLEQYANEYKKTVHQSIISQLYVLGISVVVWDTQADPSWDMAQALGAKPIFSTTRFEVFQLATTTEEAQS